MNQLSTYINTKGKGKCKGISEREKRKGKWKGKREKRILKMEKGKEKMERGKGSGVAVWEPISDIRKSITGSRHYLLVLGLSAS